MGTGAAGGARGRRGSRFARMYARVSPRMEAEGMAALRRELLAGLSGTVVEIGAGNGLNFVHYPDEVSQVIAIEPESYLRELAVAAASKASTPVDVQEGTADRLPLTDASADAVVLCLVMCSIADQTAAVAEVARILRPGGEVRFLEHTIAPTRGLRVVQRMVDATFWPALAGGCHTTSNPVGALQVGGFRLTHQRRLRFPDRRLTLPATPHVLGTAVGSAG